MDLLRPNLSRVRILEPTNRIYKHRLISSDDSISGKKGTGSAKSSKADSGNQISHLCLTPSARLRRVDQVREPRQVRLPGLIRGSCKKSNTKGRRNRTARLIQNGSTQKELGRRSGWGRRGFGAAKCGNDGRLGRKITFCSLRLALLRLFLLKRMRRTRPAKLCIPVVSPGFGSAPPTPSTTGWREPNSWSDGSLLIPRLSSADSDSKSSASEGVVIEEPWAFRSPSKIASFSSSEMNDTSPLVVDVQRTTPTTLTTPFYSLPETYLSPGIENFASPLSQAQREERDDSSIAAHSISGRFPSVSLFKEYKNAAMAILEKTDYTMIYGHHFIKKSGW
ncbi:hypothetical protein ACFXTH_000025 [Malus domestica]